MVNLLPPTKRNGGSAILLVVGIFNSQGAHARGAGKVYYYH